MTWAKKNSTVPVRRRRHPSATTRLACPARKLKNLSWLFALVLLIGSAIPARAGCDEDCTGEYVSNLGECRTDYEQGDRNTQDLEECLADTRSEYEDCVDDCTSLGAGGVVACSSPTQSLRRIVFLSNGQ
jgi:hypothetical protein